MSRIIQWLRTHGELLSHWATVLAFLAAAIGGFLTFGQLKVANAQLEQANEQRRWQNYNEMNVRYAELYESIPEEIAAGCIPQEFAKLDAKTKRWVRQYFDLYSEEYWLYENQLIPVEMWTRRIHGGVRVNLSKYPALVVGYYYWKTAGSFRHPDNFRGVVEVAIADSKRPPYLRKAIEICAPPNTKRITKAAHRIGSSSH
jgi:hypothetical protein